MQKINLAVGYQSIPSFTNLNLSLTNQLTDAEYSPPSPFQGIEGFREAIAAKLQIANGVEGLGIENILVTQGAAQALYLIAQNMINEGDEIVVTIPGWGHFKDLLNHRKVKIKEIQTSVLNQYKVTAAELEKSISQETKMLILVNPGNPGGGVFTRKEIEEIVEVIEKNPQLTILADEMYELLVFDENTFIPFSSFPSIAERVVTVNGFSKSFGLTSWRIAYLYSHNKKIISQLTKYQMLSTYGMPIASQLMAWTALQKEELYRLIWQQFAPPRRDSLFDYFNQVEGIEVYKPQGAYFLFPNMKKIAEQAGFTKSHEMCDFFAKNYNLIINDGEIFGLPFHYRVNFVQTEGIIVDAIGRFQKGFSELSRRY